MDATAAALSGRMRTVIKWLFGIPPDVGTEWDLRGEADDPFRTTPDAIVVEVKRGWVKYRWGWAKGMKTFYGDTASVRSFRTMYKERVEEWGRY